MFQSFTSSSDPAAGPGRVRLLREEMQREKIDWYLVPHADEHQNEYLPPCAERLAWLTGFTGSAGFAVIGLEEAFAFTDGRYTLQMRQQTNASTYACKDLTVEPPLEFLAGRITGGGIAGFDPALFTLAQERNWRTKLEAAGGSLRPLPNLVDRIWKDRPQAPAGRAFLHPDELAGETAISKLARIREAVRADNATHLLLTDPASLAWLFNLRGSDLAHNPLMLGHALIDVREGGEALLLADRAKFSEGDAQALEAFLRFAAPATLEAELSGLGADARLHLDPALASFQLGECARQGGATIIEKRDPVIPLRAVKNPAELAGARAAHLRDGIAVTRFLCWLDHRARDGFANGSVTEIDAARELELIRAATAAALGSELREIAFDTISGAGPNGAIVHYRVNEHTNATLETGTLYLCDSGGQYPDGTTDITRTVAIGEPPRQAVRDFTLVLKGHIAIATARFPAGTRGIDLDPLARIALWKDGSDYAHGTGHGIGSYLNVHEGPQSISRRGMEALKPGMIVSNEPGCYREGSHGIRIENLLAVHEARPVGEGSGEMLGFENLTLCPIDRRLIDAALLTAEEREWLDAYHAGVLEALAPHLDDMEREWLQGACAPLQGR